MPLPRDPSDVRDTAPASEPEAKRRYRGDDLMTQPPPASVPTLLVDEPSSGDRVLPGEGAFGVSVSFGAASVLHRAFLLVHEGDTARLLEVPDGGIVSVGRSSATDVVVDDPRVSRRHTHFVRRGTELFVQDIDSRNGTKVNGSVLRSGERRLGSGDVVRIGWLEVVVASSTAPVAPGYREGRSPPVRSGIVVADRKTREVLTLAKQLARGDTAVVVQGEAGVGKKLVALQVHRGSARAGGPLVQVNCRSFEASGEGAEEALFGLAGDDDEADGEATRIGWLEAARGGTLLLDGVDFLPAGAQASLFEALSSGFFTRVGGAAKVEVDARVVATAVRDLPSEVGAKRFHADLYYWLAAFTIALPPLRERTAEIAVLASLFAREAAADLGLPVPEFEAEAEGQLLRHEWPGNVRELRAAIKDAVRAASNGRVTVKDLPEAVQRAKRGSGRPRASSAP